MSQIGLACAALLALTLACTAPAPTATSPSPTASAQTAPPASPSAPPAACPAVRQISPGAISGRIGYPAEASPALAVIAMRPDDPSVLRVVHLPQVQGPGVRSYTIAAVEPGTYLVVAYVEGGTGNPQLSGAFTPAVACGLHATCVDHSLIPVTVRAGQDVTGIDVLDWYAPPGTFPARPAVSASLRAGDAVSLCNPYADSANMRASAGITFPVRRVVDNGTRLMVRDGPLGADGYDWYEVNLAGDPQASGWVVAYALRR